MLLPSLDDFIQLNEKKSPSLIQIVIIEGVTSNEENNLIEWKIVAVSPKLIEIDLVFS